MIYGWANMFHTTPEYVLYEMTYTNLIMYASAIPHYDDEKEEWDETKDANNPDNFFKHHQDQEEIFI